MRPLLDGRSLDALARADWDVVVVGGGIAGAGVFREAARAGLRVLLLESRDFASGTSSRSSKLVHGGIHYLARLEAGLALEALRERNRLLHDHPGLVEPIDCFLPLFPEADRGRELGVRALLGTYRALGALGGGPDPGENGNEPGFARRLGLAPFIRTVLRFRDGQTDDARLVLRILQQGVEAGGAARSFTPVHGFLREVDGGVRGVLARIGGSGREFAVRARVVVNATGPWTDRLRERLGRPGRVRLVRGSHLVVPRHRLPLPGAVVHLRRGEGTAVLMIPWEGVTLIGGTSVEHRGAPGAHPAISPDEVHRLLEDARRLFPAAGLGVGDVQATFSGFRTLVDLETGSAARASRREGIWEEDGLLTLAGGKLTTFRAMARRVLQRARPRLPPFAFRGNVAGEDEPVAAGLRRLAARYGAEGAREIRAAPPSRRLEAELAWCARAEGVRHLDDLLLRRVRLGFTAPGGGVDLLGRLEPALREALGWDTPRWQEEVARYGRLWRRTMGVPSALLPAPRVWSAPRPRLSSRRGDRSATPPGSPAAEHRR